MKGEGIGYRQVFSQKQYMKMIMANVINRFGDSIDALAFSWMVYTITEEASWSAIIFAINMLPSVFFQPFAGALAEGLNKKKAMVVTDIIRGICVSIVLLLNYKGVLNITYLVIVTIIISSVEAIRIPCAMAIIPKILDKEYYEFGTSLNSTWCRISELIGMGIAGGIIGVMGINAAIIIDILTFLISAFIISLIKSNEVVEDRIKLDIETYMFTLKEGFSYMKSVPIIMAFCVLIIFVNGGLAPLNSLETPYVNGVLGKGSYMLSILGISISAGMIIGSFIYPYISNKVSSISNMALVCYVIGIYYLSLVGISFLKDNEFVLIFCLMLSSIIFSIAIAIVSSALQVEFLKNVEEKYLARAGAIFNACACMSSPIVAISISIVSSFLSVVEILSITAIAIIVLCMLFRYLNKKKYKVSKIRRDIISMEGID